VVTGWALGGPGALLSLPDEIAAVASSGATGHSVSSAHLHAICTRSASLLHPPELLC